MKQETVWNQIKSRIEAAGYQTTILPLNVMEEAGKKIEEIKMTGWLNNFQKYCVNEKYQMELPQTDFELQSIVLVFAPVERVGLRFAYQGKQILVDDGIGYDDYTSAPPMAAEMVKNVLQPLGCHFHEQPNLPMKLLSVLSGMARYGRNNITYIEGYGSFYHVFGYYTDIPTENREFAEIRQTQMCEKCHVCMDHCPNHAIIKDRFMIDCERCMTLYNEVGSEPLPDWIDESAHNALYGCNICQLDCPNNRTHLSYREIVSFTEKETQMLLNGEPYEHYSGTTKDKIDRLCFKNYLGPIARNLPVLIKNQ